jgi:hypothetical protein
LFDGRDQALCVPRLFDETIDLALVDRRRHRIEIGIAGKQDAHRRRRTRSDFAQHVDTRHARHALVADDDVHAMAAHEFNRLAPRRRG